MLRDSNKVKYLRHEHFLLSKRITLPPIFQHSHGTQWVRVIVFDFGWIIGCEWVIYPCTISGFFRVTLNRGAWVNEFFVGAEGFVSWDVPLRRALHQFERSEYEVLLSLLSMFLFVGI